MNTFRQKIGSNGAADGWSGPKNMTLECQKLRKRSIVCRLQSVGRKLMIDMTSDFAFGQKINTMTDSEMQPVLDILSSYAWRAGIYKECPSLGEFRLEQILIALRGNTKMRKWAQWGADYTSAVLDDSDRKEVNRFSLFKNATDPITKSCPSEAELSAEIFFLMLAGRKPLKNCQHTALLTLYRV